MGNPISASITEQPHMIIEPSVDARVDSRIQLIDTSIYQDPEAFLGEIDHLGETALKSIDFSEREERVAHAARDAAGLVHEFLVNRYDLEIAYDNETESALKTDPRYKKLLLDSQSATSVIVKTGAMSSKLHANPRAETARDDFRIYRFRKYVERVAVYQRQASEAPGSLPSAG